MDEARLAEIEALFARLASLDKTPDQDWGYGEWEALDAAAQQAQHDLLAEIRRLQRTEENITKSS